MKLLTEQIITVAVAVGTVCLFIVLVDLPQRHTLDALQDQIQTQQEQLSQAKQKTSDLVILNKRVEALQEAVAEFNKRLLDRNKLGTFLEQIVGDQKSAELVSQEIRPESPTSMPRYSEFPVTMRFRGTFRNVCAFLDNIENLTHLTQVKELHLEGKRKDLPEIKATMVLNIYCNRS